MPKHTSTATTQIRADVLRAELSAELTEYRGRMLMEATIAACAIVAHADGSVAPAERIRMMELMRAHPLLALFPRDEVIHEFTRHTYNFVEDPTEAMHHAIRQVMQVAGRKRLARVVLDACLVITAADGRVDPREIEAVRLIREALDLPPDPNGAPAGTRPSPVAPAEAAGC